MAQCLKGICVCNTGYTGDGLTCTDVDECRLGFAFCRDETPECVNIAGSFVCTDPCLGDPCDANARCYTRAPGYTCECNVGYAGDGLTCKDVDECSLGHVYCQPETPHCVNTAGSFVCSACSLGNTGNRLTCTKFCQDSTYCSTVAQCLKDFCVCNTGYTGDGLTCFEVKGCSDSIECSDVAQCLKGICVCNTGYTGNGLTCTDVDECGLGVSFCRAETPECVNVEGSFVCTDPCLGDPCDANARCDRHAKGHTCVCNVGYSGDGLTCKDVDECSMGRAYCQLGTPNCLNTAGSYECVEACLSNPCDANARCDMLAKGHTCVCNVGYSGDGLTCKDVDECSMGRAYCQLGTPNCLNTAGSYECVAWNPDACLSNPCDANARCDEHAIGGGICECNQGYEGNGFSCVDQYECWSSTSCSRSAACTNTNGSYVCGACNQGYTGDGQTCSCVTSAFVCHPKAHCVAPTCHGCEVTCRCNTGYHGDGRVCEDNDECALGVSNCQIGTKCTNTDGSYACQMLDECETGIHNCVHVCIDTPGSFYCQV